MTVQRGAVYRFVDRSVGGLLVLSHDAWNAVSDTATGVVVSPIKDPDPLSVGLADGAFALPGFLVPIPQLKLGSQTYVPDDAELRAVVESVISLLSLRTLLKEPPKAPQSPPGTVTYPAWGEIYFGPAYNGQSKRYVVVSHNHHNQKTGRAVVVRTTSKPNKGRARTTNSTLFPLIEGGEAHACCPDIRTLGHAELDVDPPAKRPDPAALAMADMSTIARGLTQALALTP